MESVENIRDTNWVKFSSDYGNCWDVKDYNANCIGNPGNRFPVGSYILVQSGTLWTLSGTITPSGTYGTYITQFPVFLDSNGLTTYSGSSVGCTSSKTVDCKTIFTREIRINYPSNDHMEVNSIVTWKDSSGSSPHSIDLETVLTNWKKEF